MHIGFDAKRAFCNGTGLGVYSRNLLSSLQFYFPEHNYHLFTPRTDGRYFSPGKEYTTHLPPKGVLGAWWRTFGQPADAARAGVGVYHGLSHELPYGLSRRGIRSVVTIHDLIFLRYPEYFGALDRQIYNFKFRSACRRADKIVSVSTQTKADIVHYFGISPERIEVIYQANQLVFEQPDYFLSKKIWLEKRPALPPDYILYVGSVIPRKNLLGLVRALGILAAQGLRPTLAVVGEGKSYLLESLREAERLGVRQQILLLGQVERAAMPGLYRGARMLAYPSFFEGFGIPIIEALSCGTPVVTSAGGCFPEAAGDAALFVDPAVPASIAESIGLLFENQVLYEKLSVLGPVQAGRFSRERAAREWMALYGSL